MQRTGTASVVGCRAYKGLEHGLQWTVENTENWHWVSNGLWNIRKTGTLPILDCRLYGGLVLDL